MAYLVYDESPTRGAYRGPPLSRMDPTKMWLRHYANSLFLSAILASPRDRAEAQQASRELAVCDRKLAYWARMYGYSQAEALAGAAELKRQWASRG